METPFYRSLPALVVALALIISTIIGAATFYTVRSFDNTLAVTGSATKQVRADNAKWTLEVKRTTTQANMKAAYAQLGSDTSRVSSYFKGQGISDNDMVVSPVYTEQVYKQYDNGIQEYNLRQTIQISSTDVDKITALSKSIQNLINQDVFVTTQSLEYYYSKLPELRVALLGDALRDAQARASSLAGTSGKRIGQLKAASSGVVQVLPLNSVDISDYGTYDTQSVDKQIMVTVKASFTLR